MSSPTWEAINLGLLLVLGLLVVCSVVMWVAVQLETKGRTKTTFVLGFIGWCLFFLALVSTMMRQYLN